MLRLLLATVSAFAQPAIDWSAVEQEALRHFTALVQINSTDPGGSEKPVVDYLKAVLDKEGIESKIFIRENLADPSIVRPNIVARIKGSGKKRPLLIIGHTDTVNIDPKKWKHGPFSAHREGGHIYGRGTVDDKDNLTAALMATLLVKRQGLKLDRDLIFLAEAGEEGATSVGIAFLVNQHYPDIDAEYCLAEGGSSVRTGGKLRYFTVQTTEKIPRGAKLVATGVAGHGSVFFPPASKAPLDYYASHALRERYPELNTTDTLILLMALKRVMRERAMEAAQPALAAVA